MLPSAAACRHPLSETLQKRIRAHEGNRSKRGFCCQLVIGLCLPAGLLTQGEWDYDRQVRPLPCGGAAGFPAVPAFCAAASGKPRISVGCQRGGAYRYLHARPCRGARLWAALVRCRSAAALHAGTGRCAPSPAHCCNQMLCTLPATPLLPLDRDMDVLRKEASAVLSTSLHPTSYELLEHIDSEAAFAGGKVLFNVYVK